MNTKAELVVALGGTPVGLLAQTRTGALHFSYAEGYGNNKNDTPLSLSMLPAGGDYRGTVPRNWLRNLLPDNDQVLARWGRQFGVSPNNPFALLRHVGQDVAGAVQFVTDDNLQQLAIGSAEQLSNDDVLARLSELSHDQTAWTDESGRGMFSLAGAQPKLALQRTPDGWALPSGRAPSTHIFKPYGSQPLPEWALNEHLTMRAAAELGLPTASTRLQLFGDLRVLVVTRYDRVLQGDNYVRVHQEDFCQVLGLPLAKKYQADGGPGVSEIVAALRSHLPPDAAAGAILDFIRAQAFIWATAGTDAHAKNYSVLLAGPQVRLAPLYDLHSAAPHLTSERRNIPAGALSVHTAGLAMRIGKARVFSDVAADDWRGLAAGCGLDADHVLAEVRAVVGRVPEAVTKVAELVAGNLELTRPERTFSDGYVRAVTRHAELCAATLAGRGAPSRRNPIQP